MISSASLFRLFFEYGLLTMGAVFGAEDSYLLLRPLLETPNPKYGFWKWFLKHMKASFGISMGLVSIPPILIMSRTSLADGILPIIPMIVFACTPQASDNPNLDFGDWPPSAGLSFALLPYLRSAYNLYYEKVWGEKERRWLREIQPRSASSVNEGEDNQDEDINDADNIIEINIDLLEEIHEPPLPPLEGEIADQNRDNREPAPQPDGPVRIDRPLHAPAMADGVPQLEQVNGLNNQPAPAAQPAAQPEQGRALNLNVTTTRLADTILGALAFPFVSSAMGDLLKFALPQSWTVTPYLARRRTGFLQTRWARTLVGGCLFVVLKDALMLYVRWKMAQNHRKRKILNYDKVKKRVIRD
jgi:hypothetical protein